MRVVFAGTGPLLYLVAAQYVKAGAHVEAVLDTSSLWKRVRALPKLAARPRVLLNGVSLMRTLRGAGVRVVTGIELEEVYPFINPVALFRGQWGVKKGTLSDAEYEALLWALAETPGKVVTRQQLVERVWGSDLPSDTGLVDTHRHVWQSGMRGVTAQIVDALRAGAHDADAVVARLYAGLDDELRARARETVVAHLLKLEREGRALRHGDLWTVTD